MISARSRTLARRPVAGAPCYLPDTTNSQLGADAYLALYGNGVGLSILNDVGQQFVFTPASYQRVGPTGATGAKGSRLEAKFHAALAGLGGTTPYNLWFSLDRVSAGAKYLQIFLPTGGSPSLVSIPATVSIRHTGGGPPIINKLVTFAVETP